MWVWVRGREFFVVLIALVLIFKEQITTLVNSIFSTITDSAGTV